MVRCTPAFGYKGVLIINAAEGLRLLLSAPELNDMDWGTIMGFAPSDDSSAYPAAPPAAPGDARMTQLENRLVSLATSFHGALGPGVHEPCRSLVALYADGVI